MTPDTLVPPPTRSLDPAPELRHNPARSRYELWSGEELIGLVGYETNDSDELVLLHTVVTEQFCQAGFARLLVMLVLDDLARENRRARAVCTYIQSFVERFPQYSAVVTPA